MFRTLSRQCPRMTQKLDELSVLYKEIGQYYLSDTFLWELVEPNDITLMGRIRKLEQEIYELEQTKVNSKKKI